MTRPTTAAISRFFIVSDIDQTIVFFRAKLGFETTFQEPDRNPFFAITRRDGAQLFVKPDRNGRRTIVRRRCRSLNTVSLY